MTGTEEQGAKKGRKGGAKKGGAKKSSKGSKKGAAKKAAKASKKAERKEKRYTQSDAVVGAIKALTRKGGAAEMSKIYERATGGEANEALFANTKDPKATIRAILQRDRRIQRVDGGWGLVATDEGGAATGGETAAAETPAKPKRASRKKAAEGEGGEEAAPAKPKRASRKKAAAGDAPAEGTGELTVEREAGADEPAGE